MMTKGQLRKIYLKKRANLSKDQIDNFSTFIFERFISNYSLSNKTTHCFKSIPGSKEIVTDDFFNHCLDNNIQIATSITKFKPKRLEHSLIEKATIFESDNFGVPTPKKIIACDITKINLVVVPLLCCDFEGNRIGYGQGFYDSFLTQLPKDTLKIGLSFFEPLETRIPADKWDIKLNGMVTPDDLFKF
jgi:5-formyltetrahydrofolate cyclo-ligase